MSLFQLDEYSIRDIFYYLDVQSHQNFACTCKKLHAFSKQFYNITTFQKDLQTILIEFLFEKHNRDDIPANIRLRYETEFLLKSFKHTFNVCQFLKNPNIENQAILRKLIFKSALSSPLPSALKNLCEIGFHSRINVNYFYAFNVGEDVTVFLCNVKHPEYEIHQQGLASVVMGIWYDERNHKEKFYCCNVTRIDWFVSELSSAVFSNSYDILAPLCVCLKKLFTEKSVKELITPKALIELASFDCQSSTSADGCNVYREKSFHEAVIKSTKTAFSSQASALISERGDVSKNFLNALKYYCNFCSPNSTFFTSFVNFVRPVMKELSIFDYGELLPYVPVVKLLLQNVKIDEIFLEKDEQKIKLTLNSNLLEVKLVKCRTRSFLLYQITLNDDVVFKAVGKEDGEEEVVKGNTSNLLENTFDDFIESKCPAEVISKLPVTSVNFIFTFLDSLVLVPITLSAELEAIRNNLFTG